MRGALSRERACCQEPHRVGGVRWRARRDSNPATRSNDLLIYEYVMGDGWGHALLDEKIVPAEGREARAV